MERTRERWYEGATRAAGLRRAYLNDCFIGCITLGGVLKCHDIYEYNTTEAVLQ